MLRKGGVAKRGTTGVYHIYFIPALHRSPSSESEIHRRLSAKYCGNAFYLCPKSNCVYYEKWRAYEKMVKYDVTDQNTPPLIQNLFKLFKFHRSL